MLSTGGEPDRMQNLNCDNRKIGGASVIPAIDVFVRVP
jgi:hypothetical protein